MEYSGTSNIGQIMGLATYEQLTLKIIPDDTLNWVIPVGWTLEDAATVPLAYATVSFLIMITVLTIVCILIMLINPAQIFQESNQLDSG